MDFLGRVDLNGSTLELELEPGDERLRQFAGQTVRVRIERYEDSSTNQFNFYRGVLIPIIREELLQIGNQFGSDLHPTLPTESLNNDLVHRWLKIHLLGRERINSQGERELFVPSLKDLSMKEFASFIDLVNHFILEFLGVQLPLPSTNNTYHYVISIPS